MSWVDVRAYRAEMRVGGFHMYDSKDATTPIARMVCISDRLIEAQRLELSLGKVCSKRGTPQNLEAWKESRRWVEAFAEEYACSVREWREGIESQLARTASRNEGSGGQRDGGTLPGALSGLNLTLKCG